MWILWKMRFWNCEFCEKWDFEIMNFVKKWDFGIVNFVKNEILLKLRFWNCEFCEKMRLWNCEFCEKWGLSKCEFLDKLMILPSVWMGLKMGKTFWEALWNCKVCYLLNHSVLLPSFGFGEDVSTFQKCISFRIVIWSVWQLHICIYPCGHTTPHGSTSNLSHLQRSDPI